MDRNSEDGQQDGYVPPEQSSANVPYFPAQPQQPPLPTGFSSDPPPAYDQLSQPGQAPNTQTGHWQPGYGQYGQGQPQYLAGLPPMHHPGQPIMQVQPRNPVLYALASFLIAGLGTMLGGQVGRGLLILVAVVVTWMLLFVPFIWLLTVPLWLGAWVFSVVDGYRTAQKWNRQHGIIS